MLVGSHVKVYFCFVMTELKISFILFLLLLDPTLLVCIYVGNTSFKLTRQMSPNILTKLLKNQSDINVPKMYLLYCKHAKINIGKNLAANFGSTTDCTLLQAHKMYVNTYTSDLNNTLHLHLCDQSQSSQYNRTKLQ